MTTTENTKIWDSLKRVPPEHLKGFSRAGGFKGTAIKPMWSFHAMTEMFGACGIGWGVNEPTFQVVNGDNKEVLVFCTVSVWHSDGDDIIYGVGGDKIVKYIPANPQYNRSERWENDDEAFKKAYTDAITNALKLIGVGADIHMGLWDGNKYADEKPEAPQPVSMPSVQGTPGASKAGYRAIYEKHVKIIRDAPTIKVLTDWHKANVTEIDELPPDWIDDMRTEYNDRMHELKKGLVT